MWRLFYGSATQQAAEVYVLWTGHSPPPDGPVTLRGPFCRWSRTLPMKSALQQRSDNLWQTTLVDPCFWSPALPARYRLECEGHSEASCELGIRHFGTRGRHLFLCGERVVLRGVDLTGEIASEDLGSHFEALRDAHVNFAIATDPQKYGPGASECGVLLAIRIPTAEWESATVQATRWPAVGMLILPVDAIVDDLSSRMKELAPNQLVVAEIVDSKIDGPLPERADAILIHGDKTSVDDLSGRVGERPRMVVDVKRRPETAAEARRECERLQAALAPEFDLEGYVVGSDGAHEPS